MARAHKSANSPLFLRWVFFPPGWTDRTGLAFERTLRVGVGRRHGKGARMPACPGFAAFHACGPVFLPVRGIFSPHAHAITFACAASPSRAPSRLSLPFASSSFFHAKIFFFMCCTCIASYHLHRAPRRRSPLLSSLSRWAQSASRPIYSYLHQMNVINVIVNLHPSSDVIYLKWHSNVWNGNNNHSSSLINHSSMSVIVAAW